MGAFVTASMLAACDIPNEVRECFWAQVDHLPLEHATDTEGNERVLLNTNYTQAMSQIDLSTMHSPNVGNCIHGDVNVYPQSLSIHHYSAH